MRIVGGRHRGLRLANPGPGDPAAHLRPTADRTREAMFNILTNGRLGNRVAGARVLDLFAGTGALGIEALSRGAAHATFVDDGRVALRLIRENLSRAGRTADALVLPRRAAEIGESPGTPANLVFLDPPYGMGLGAPALAAAQAGGWVAPGALILWEDSAPAPPMPGFSVVDERRYGAATLSFLQAAG